MNNKLFRSSFGKSFYCFLPLLIYLCTVFVVQTIFVNIFVVQYMKEHPSFELNASNFDLLRDKALDWLISVNAPFLIAVAIVTIIVLGFMFFRNEYKVFDKKHKNKLNIKDLLATISLSLGFYMLLTIMLTILQNLFDMRDIFSQYNDTTAILFTGDLLLVVLAVGILTPISEEIILRGLFFNRLRLLMNPRQAVFLSALIFGMMHFTGSMVQISYAFLLGYILAYAYFKYENILIPIIIHVTFNMANFLFQIEIIARYANTTWFNLGYYISCMLLVSYGIKYLVSKEKPAVLS